jgi:hypothetical protein
MMPALTDSDLWAVAARVMEAEGDSVGEFILERVHAMTEIDLAGCRRSRPADDVRPAERSQETELTERAVGCPNKRFCTLPLEFLNPMFNGARIRLRLYELVC